MKRGNWKSRKAKKRDLARHSNFRASQGLINLTEVELGFMAKLRQFLTERGLTTKPLTKMPRIYNRNR